MAFRCRRFAGRSALFRLVTCDGTERQRWTSSLLCAAWFAVVYLLGLLCRSPDRHGRDQPEHGVARGRSLRSMGGGAVALALAGTGCARARTARHPLPCWNRTPLRMHPIRSLRRLLPVYWRNLYPSKLRLIRHLHRAHSPGKRCQPTPPSNAPPTSSSTTCTTGYCWHSGRSPGSRTAARPACTWTPPPATSYAKDNAARGATASSFKRPPTSHLERRPARSATAISGAGQEKCRDAARARLGGRRSEQRLQRVSRSSRSTRSHR